MNMRIHQENQTSPEADARKPRATSEKQEQEAEWADRETLGAILDLDELDPVTSLEVVANYSRDNLTDARLDDMRLIASDFGLNLDALDSVTRNELVTLQAAAEKISSEGGRAGVVRAMNELMREKLTDLAMTKIDGLYQELVTSNDVEEIKTRFREVMRTLVDLAKQMPPELEAHDKTWLELYDRLISATSLKNKEGVMPQAAEALKSVVSEFEDEIEDEYIKREMRRLVAADQVYYVEDLIARIYGRSPEDLEEIKSRNRGEVVAEIMRMKDDPEVSIETLVSLYTINNRGVVPKEISRLRKGNEAVGFGKRIGLLHEDLVPEMEAMLDRAEALIGRNIVKGVAEPVYEIAAAKLHNDLLDMHPFPDRNGSTAVLFLELLMSKTGYVPDSKRPKSYYGHLREVLGNNPLAIGLIGYEQFKIANVPGYYEGASISKDEGKAELYDLIVNENIKEDRERSARSKARKKSKKTGEKP